VLDDGLIMYVLFKQHYKPYKSAYIIKGHSEDLYNVIFFLFINKKTKTYIFVYSDYSYLTCKVLGHFNQEYNSNNIAMICMVKVFRKTRSFLELPN
jgi:hypothetical protein